MRREERRARNLQKKSFSDKIIIYSAIGVAILTAILIGLLIYSKNLSDDVKNSTMSLEEMANMTNNTNTENTENTESASTEIGKTVEESKNETSNTTSNTNSNTNVNTTNTSTANRTTNTSTNTNANTNTTSNVTTPENTTTTNTEEPEEVVELSFQMPVEGEITKQYARDNLVYSNTLEEWTTHLGIDIKAEKTSVVKASEAGTVKSIKNDPRYGLTIVIEHNKQYQTVYSNLLSSEFVVEGEKVEKGQSIGTVGNTAAFEIADEPHLHFEILKDSIQEDPTIYLK